MRTFREFAVGAKVVNTTFAFLEAIRMWVEWHAKGGFRAPMPQIGGGGQPPQRSIGAGGQGRP